MSNRFHYVPMPPLNIVRNTFEYDEITGILTWSTVKTNRIKKGSEAGTLTEHGYRRITWGDKRYKSHRIIWFLFYGTDPDKDIDHINGNRQDNRISNLRLTTITDNNQNTTGKGYTYIETTNKWRARIQFNSKQKHLGYFDTQEEAINAYLKAKETYHLKWYNNDK